MKERDQRSIGPSILLGNGILCMVIGSTAYLNPIFKFKNMVIDLTENNRLIGSVIFAYGFISLFFWFRNSKSPNHKIKADD